jgi:uncharacterized protein
MDTLTDERLDREFKVTAKSLETLEIIIPTTDKYYPKALFFKDTATRYFKDAKFFKEKGDKASAFGALNYAFGWLDAGKSVGLFKETDHLDDNKN